VSIVTNPPRHLVLPHNAHAGDHPLGHAPGPFVAARGSAVSVGQTAEKMTNHSTPPDLEELTHFTNDAFNRRDFDGLMTRYSQNPVWDTSAVGLGVHEGREAVRAFQEEWLQAYEDFEGVVAELCDLGNGISMAVFQHRAKPTGGSGFVEFRFALVTTWTGGLVERVTAFTDVDEARSAAGRLAEDRG